ncbi:MAG: lipoate--protein ligase [Bacteroidetes bacterium]|nr:lipoate--protein ligase [Bacteroidota bacterium]
MLCIVNENKDPFFNIASEEYIFRNFNEDCFMLWRSEPSVIVGRHQNTLAEINWGFIKRHNIKVVRRLSGGGAVYHDPGNLNFTFIMRGQKGKPVDFKKFTDPVIKALASLSVTAKFEGKNDLRVNGLKISGNAEHIFRDKILHHGTLLFDSNLDNLENAVKKDEDHYSDKAVKSIRSQVTNISSYLKEIASISEFKELVQSFMFNYFPNTSFYHFTNEDIKKISKLVEEKYFKWEWNYGCSPRYMMRKIITAGKYRITVELIVSKGIIEKFCMCDSGQFSDELEKISASLTGLQHEETSLAKKLSEFHKSSFFQSISIIDFVHALF